MARRKERKRPPLPPAPEWSACVYLELRREDVGLFRFLLEAEDNLAYMSVVDRWRSVLQVVFSPQQEKELLACLERIRALVPFRPLPLPERIPFSRPPGGFTEKSPGEAELVPHTARR